MNLFRRVIRKGLSILLRMVEPKEIAAKVSTEIDTNHFVCDESSKLDLIIFDDFLPNLLGSWRSVEMATYLVKFKSNLVCMLKLYGPKMFNSHSNFETDKNLFLDKYGAKINKESIIGIDQPDKININSKLAYCIFHTNLKTIYPLLCLYKIPFVFTLYPGGGFKFYKEESEKFLAEVKDSYLFKGVIVTQQSVYDYLIKRLNFDPTKLKLIYGCPMDFSEYRISPQKKYFGAGKETLDICFVAAKYSKYGVDKGFDVFCEVALSLTKRFDFIKFHVVGGYTFQDMLYPVRAESISFYGYQYFDWFKGFYENMDIILSPVKANVLDFGAFDGFPSGGVIDAGLFGVAMMSSDPTGDNCLPGFEDEKDMFLIESNIYSVMKKILRLLDKPEHLKSVAEAGSKKLANIFNKEHQLDQRVIFLSKLIN